MFAVMNSRRSYSQQRSAAVVIGTLACVGMLALTVVSLSHYAVGGAVATAAAGTILLIYPYQLLTGRPPARVITLLASAIQRLPRTARAKSWLATVLAVAAGTLWVVGALLGSPGTLGIAGGMTVALLVSLYRSRAR